MIRLFVKNVRHPRCEVSPKKDKDGNVIMPDRYKGLRQAILEYQTTGRMSEVVRKPGNYEGDSVESCDETIDAARNSIDKLTIGVYHHQKGDSVFRPVSPQVESEIAPAPAPAPAPEPAPAPSV